jgi:phospholipid/cholesterol/gamma-HCH transport system ATP-binding protein
MTKAIEVRDLRHAYDDTVVLDGVDLSVETGEALVILGGSGSGKSTLLRCMLGLERPLSGTVSILGQDIHHAAPLDLARLRQRIGMAFQSGALFGSLTIGENVDLPLAEFTGLPDSTRSIIVRIKLALVGLDEAADRHPSELSGGMKKRAAFARAMALDPDVLFCDEPSAGLDPVTAAGLDRLLIQLKEVFGITLVVVTHELESAFAVADRIALIHRGRVLITGTPDELRRSTDPVVRRFLNRQPAKDGDDGSRFRRWMTEEEADA